MDKIIDSILRFIRGISKIVWLSILAIALLIGGGIALVGYINKDNSIKMSVNDRIDITPQQIQSIQEIGQWEFLAINDEEIVDTVARRFISDKELVRIYYGTLRFGIDLHKAKPKWLRVEGDSVVVATLPAVELLDRNFIDETRSQSFFEEGNWTPADRERLYNKAYRKMLNRCYTAKNIETAEQNARYQMEKLLKGIGFERVRVEFERFRKPHEAYK